MTKAADDHDKCEVCGSTGEVHCRGMSGGAMLCTACAAECVEFNIAAEVFEHGAWRSCTGCHELDEGHPRGPYSTAFRCNLGVGCRECGGIGAVWEQFPMCECKPFPATSMAGVCTACGGLLE